jgi:hypothetical protein
VLRRALAAEAVRSALRGLTFSVAPYSETWLPIRGRVLYRSVRALLRQAAASAQPCQIRVAVLETVAGKSHVELTASFRIAGSVRVLSCRLPRFVEDTLWMGFNELAIEDLSS